MSGKTSRGNKNCFSERISTGKEGGSDTGEISQQTKEENSKLNWFRTSFVLEIQVEDK